MAKELRIGLFGFGCVGQGLYDIIEKTHFQADLVKICVKNRQKKRSIPQDYFTFDREDLLENPNINVIVELIDDAQEAYKIVKKALKKGKQVVTANKKMVAEHLEEFVQIQEDSGAALLYEASVCGSIPIIRNLAEYYDNELLFSVSGIFNGSSNYILSKVIQENLSYAEALQEAQEKGFAESDPLLDVGGFDPKYKLCIVVAHAYGLFIPPEEVFNYGIQTLSAHDIEFAQEKGYKIKLLAQVKREGESALSLLVMPCFIQDPHYLYHIENEYNAAIVEAAFSDKQVFVGKGAGGHPTGSAVLSDISALKYEYKYAYKKRNLAQDLFYSRELALQVYFRYYQDSDLELLNFSDISVRYSGKEYQYLIGKVSLEELYQKKSLLEKKDVFLALI